jgi:hypothetical protein
LPNAGAKIAGIMGYLMELDDLRSRIKHPPEVPRRQRLGAIWRLRRKRKPRPQARRNRRPDRNSKSWN